MVKPAEVTSSANLRNSWKPNLLNLMLTLVMTAIPPRTVFRELHPMSLNLIAPSVEQATEGGPFIVYGFSKRKPMAIYIEAVNSFESILFKSHLLRSKYKVKLRLP